MPSATVQVETIVSGISPEDAVVSFGRMHGASILECVQPCGSNERFSVFAFDPVTSFSQAATNTTSAVESVYQHTTRNPNIELAPSCLPFVGGWIGYFTYEAGARLERAIPDGRYETSLPIAHFNLYDAGAIFDHDRNQWLLFAVDWPDGCFSHRPTISARLRALRHALVDPPRHPRRSQRQPPEVSTNLSKADYCRRVETALHYVASGDVYQVNLSQRFEATMDVDPLSLYLDLRSASPAPFAAFLPSNETSIISASPELFLRLRGRHVLTRPIKGTRPRSLDPVLDEAYRHDLMDSPKDHAELAMIVDLLRNDLGRVCSFGSVHVLDEGAIESHPSVFHRVATIEGTLAAGQNWSDLLRATLPGGSITGAPKIRAMQIINELEPTPRGIYCGAIGWIGLDGSMTMNVAIRTMTYRMGVVRWYAGGAIVADSDPQLEYEESLAKAGGMFVAAGCSRSIPTEPMSSNLAEAKS